MLHNTNPSNPADGQVGTIVSGTFLNGHQGGSYDVVDDTYTVTGAKRNMPHSSHS
jgi:hypothetical protein